MTTAHEPRRGPGVHLSTEDLSALAEGAQPTAEGASEHLFDCAECRAEVDAIAQLLAAFETLEPPRLPQDVAIRIDAAIAREAATRAASPSPVAAASTSETSARDGASNGRRRWWLSRRLGVGLASLAVLAGGLTVAVNLVSSSTSGTSGAASSGRAAIHPDASTNNGPRAEGQFTAPTVAPDSLLAVWVRQTLRGNKPQLALYSPCQSDPAFAGQTPLRVVDGTYDGQSATLLIYPNNADPTTVRAVVYARSCAGSNYDVLAQGLVAK